MWYDVGMFDVMVVDVWLRCGGVNGLIRFDVELVYGVNVGLKKVLGYV